MRLRLLAWTFCTCCFCSVSKAGLLTDVEMFFDPDTLSPGLYGSYDLPDLSIGNTVSWAGGSDPVVGAQLLPVLKDAEYEPGHVFTQNDYFQVPNVDYQADLTDGTLTTTFDAPGLYHVRVTRQSSATEVHSVFAQSALFGDVETAPPMNYPMPDADLFVVTGPAGDDGLNKSEKVFKIKGKNTARTNDKAGVVKAIKDAYDRDGKKKHVEINAHGEGNGRINLGDIVIDPDNVLAFQKEIHEYVKELTFIVCWAGEGDDGATVLQTLADSIKGPVSGWDCMTDIYWITNNATGEVIDGYLTRDVKGHYITKTPEPGTLALLALGGLVVFRCKRNSSARHTG